MAQFDLGAQTSLCTQVDLFGTSSVIQVDLFITSLCTQVYLRLYRCDFLPKLVTTKYILFVCPDCFVQAPTTLVATQ